MSEGQSFELEGKRGALSRIKDTLKNKSWAKEVAQQHDSVIEQVGDITETLGIIPVFLDEKAIKEMFSHWYSHGGDEVGGWTVGTEGVHDGHKYLHVTKVVPDSGSGTYGEFHFEGPFGAYDYVKRMRKAGEHLVVIGTIHTHPKGWSGKITGQGRDSTMFSTYENIKGELLSDKRSHIVMTPADDNKVDIWQAKDTNEMWDKRLVRTGYFLLKSKSPAPSRVKIKD